MELQDKIFKYFEGKVVRKDLTKIIKGNAVVPTYVLEYLLGQHCATFDEDIIASGLEKVKNIIRDHFVHRDEAEYVKSTIREKGQHKIIDKIQVWLNEKKDIYEASFTNLGLKRVEISDRIIKKHKKLLAGGVWCILDMGYQHETGEKHDPWLIQDLKPIQISNVDLNEYIKLRKEFTREEWVDLLIQTMGLEPSQFNFRSKLLQITRLIPHCENNFNFIELGPKGTGKSHVFSELSPHGILISGGEVTQAKLFIHNVTNQIGLVGYWDVVAFDEFAGSSKKADTKLIDIMKNYMANKSFSRGRDVFGATASFAFVGNTEHSVPYMIKNSNLFDALPKQYYDTAFLDRIHTYLPGWEIKKLRNEMFTSGYGFIVDYLAEILKELRKDDFSQKIKEYIDLNEGLTSRDRDGITKTFSGLMKIIYPDSECSHEDAVELITIAVEGRKRVKDQLIKMDDTFEYVTFSYLDKSANKKVQVETLENIEHNFRFTPKGDTEDSEETFGDEKDSEEHPKVLKPGQLIIRENQTGVSFAKIFGPYLQEAKKIVLVDPYIRLYHQMNLLLEFCSMLIDQKGEDEEIELHVHTWNETEETLEESRNNLEEISETVFDMGIKLTYELTPNIHDRYIQADNGWKILMGRGLDIYTKPEGRFNIADIRQEKRQCRACEITYVQI